MFKQVKIAWGPSLLLAGGLFLWQPPTWLASSRLQTPTHHGILAGAVLAEEHVVHEDGDDVLVVDEKGNVSGPLLIKVKDREVRGVKGPYIGVRLSPVPDALAAHVGDDGLMVTNIVANSPADNAGVKQYDIIISFNDQPIGSPKQLTDLIKDAVDHKSSLQVKRGVETLRIKLTPQERKTDEPVEWKYAPELPLVDDLRQLRGMKVQRDADGNWDMLDLGMLNDDDRIVRRFDIDFTKRFPGQDIFVFDGHDFGPVDEQEVFAFEKADGDQRLRVEQDEKGITVTRTDADGGKEVCHYDSEDELYTADPEAHAFLDESKQDTAKQRGKVGRFEFHWPRDIENIDVLRDDFQTQLQQRIEDVQRRSEEARIKAEAFAHEAREHAAAIAESARRAFAGELEKHVLHQADGGTLTVYKYADGALRVIHRPSPSEEHTYRFDAQDAFAERLPQLYQQYEESLRE